MNNAQMQLVNALNSLANTEQIAEVLSVSDISSYDEEFWKIQRFTAANRFYWMLLDSLDINLSTRIDELSSHDLEFMTIAAEKLLNDETFGGYKAVRHWYKHLGGSFKVEQANDLRREIAYLDQRGFRVLFIFNKGAHYLCFNGDDPMLVDDVIGAHVFDVFSVSELTKQSLADKAKHFQSLKNKFGAKEVKVLACIK